MKKKVFTIRYDSNRVLVGRGKTDEQVCSDSLSPHPESPLAVPGGGMHRETHGKDPE